MQVDAFCHISIIVPVYNTEKYLDRCIQSVLAQTYTNWELLLIDDGSTDSSGAICDKYAAQDSRIKVFHKANGGVSSARNLGLDNAKGEWITFVDADDWIKPNFLSNLASLIGTEIDLVISYAERHYIDGAIQIESYPAQHITQENFHSAFTDYDLHWHTSPWGKLYKSAICKSLRFIYGMPIGEDLVFLYSYLSDCKSLYISSNTDYCYLVDNPHSLTKKSHHYQVELFIYRHVYECTQKIISNRKITNTDALNKCKWIFASYTRRVLNALYQSSDITKTQRIEFIQLLDLHSYTTYIDKPSIREFFYIFLIKHRAYNLYDFIRQCVRLTKRLCKCNTQP